MSGALNETDAARTLKHETGFGDENTKSLDEEAPKSLDEGAPKSLDDEKSKPLS